jgi:hypothetical protein
VGAHSGHPVKRSSLLLLVLGIVSVVAACGGNDVSPTVTSGTAATTTSGTLSTGEVAQLFDYDRRLPLAITRLGLTARLPPARELDGVTVQSITYASPKGGEVPALVVVPKGRGPFPGVIVQHGLPDTKEGMLPAGIDLARTGAVAAVAKLASGELILGLLGMASACRRPTRRNQAAATTPPRSNGTTGRTIADKHPELSALQALQSNRIMLSGLAQCLEVNRGPSADRHRPHRHRRPWYHAHARAHLRARP